MGAFVLPTNLVDTVRRDPSPERREWVRRLPATLGEVAERWDLRPSEPYQPGGSCSWVAPVQDAAGRELVLKIGWRHDEAAHEAEGLRAWEGRGAVLLHDAYVSGQSSVLLLERCTPGRVLGLTVPEPDQDRVVAQLLQQLWSASPEDYPFRPLQALCDAWAVEFEERLAASPGLIDPGLARDGIGLLRTLPGTAERVVLLCTDLHGGNVLAAEREPWLVIDPKPHVGDAAYDPVQHMLNCHERLAADPVRLARRMADLLGLPAERVIRWLFARCVQESIDEPSLAGVAVALAPR